MEKWKALNDEYFSYLEISDTGRLRNSESGHIFKLRIKKDTFLTFCDVTTFDKQGAEHRKTIYITREVAEAFVKKPIDFNEKIYKAVHKPRVSKLNNLAVNICWKSQSEICSDNMKNYPQNRNLLAEINKQKLEEHKAEILEQEKVREQKLKEESKKTVLLTKGDLSEIYHLLRVATFKSQKLNATAHLVRKQILQLQEN